jgi:hypothetical protein
MGRFIRSLLLQWDATCVSNETHVAFFTRRLIEDSSFIFWHESCCRIMAYTLIRRDRFGGRSTSTRIIGAAM